MVAGGGIGYTITIANQGPHPAEEIVLEDQLPVGVTLMNITTSQGSCTGVTVITCDLGDLAKDATANIDVQVQTASVLPQGFLLTNLVAVSSIVPDPDPPTTRQPTHNIERVADLHFVKADTVLNWSR